MAVVIMGIQTKKRQRTNNLSKYHDYNFKPLAHYLYIAKNCISKYASPQTMQMLLCSEDAISHVAESIIVGITNYKPDMNCTLKSYMNKCAQWSISRWLSAGNKATTKNIQSLDYEYGSGDDAMTIASTTADKRDLSNKDNEYWKETYSIVSEMVDNPQLGKKCKAMRMYYVDGKSYNQISETLGVSKQAVWTQIQNGTKTLKQLYC